MKVPKLEGKKRYLNQFAILFSGIVLIVGIFYFINLRFVKFFTISESGYMITSNKIFENLNSAELSGSDEEIDYTYVNENDNIYIRGNKYYLGESTNTEVIPSIPIVSSDGNRLTNISDSNNFIDSSFNSTKSFTNSILSAGSLYNGMSLDLVDQEKYILVTTNSSLYVNTVALNLVVNGEEFKIPTNSIVNFLENEIRYYTLNDGTYVYKRIGSIEMNDIIKFYDKEITYQEFLEKLDIITVIEEIPEEPIEEPVVTETPEEKEPNIVDEEGNGLETDDDIKVIYVKPEVKASINNVSVYLMNVNVDVYDPAKRIATSPTFEIYLKDKIITRKTAYLNGSLEILGLIPDTSFTLVGYYTYRDEENKLFKKTIIEQEFSTKNIDSLETINLVYENNNIFSNKIELENLHFNNGANDEVLKGLKNVSVIIGDNTFPINSSLVSSLKKLGTETYTTPSSLISNSFYDVSFTATDSAGNNLKINYDKETLRTCKEKPSAEITIDETNLTYFSASISYVNPDNVELSNVHYILTDGNNIIVSQGNVISDKISVNDLDVNTIYNLSLYADYDIGEKEGISKNVLLKSVKISTTPLSVLGYIRFNLTQNSLNQNDASYKLVVNKSSTEDKLLQLLDKVYITIKNKDTNTIVKVVEFSGDDVEKLISGDYVTLNLVNLYSKTEYSFDITTDVRQGSKVYNINSLSNMKEFKTLKKPAVVELINQFSTENLIDYDVRIQDDDGAIGVKRVLLEVRNNEGALVYFKELAINKDYERITLSKLDKDVNYNFQYKVEDYNLGYNNATYEEDKTLLEDNIVTKQGVYGNVDLESLLKSITSKNLFDITNDSRWIKDGGSTINQREVNRIDKTIKLSAKNGYANYSYYLPEGKGKTLSVSFYAKQSDDSNMQDVYLSYGGGSNHQILLSNLGTEWVKYTYNITLSSNYYMGFYVNELGSNNTVTTVIIKNLLIESASDSASEDVSDSYYDSNYVFHDTNMISGYDSMPNYDGNGSMDGNVGNGHARITNVNSNEVYNFSYTGSFQSFTLKSNTPYRIELWGASGGYSNIAYTALNYGSRPGRGAYTSGEITVIGDREIYVYVGGVGSYGRGTSAYGGPLGGFNGGGNGGNSGSGSGGGATDVRVVSGSWNDLNSLKARIMVAAGGGGGDDAGGTLNGSNDGRGGSGGTIISNGTYINGVLYTQWGAGQIPSISSGGFGIGANATTNTDTGGGGGGWYGGGASNNSNGGGAGGSSYISGHLGCISYNKQLSMDLTYSDYSESDLYRGSFSIDIYDTKNELMEKKFYIQLFNNNVEEGIFEYDMTDTNKAEDFLVSYDFKKNTSYEVRLGVKIRGRLYLIKSNFFTTEDEIRVIKTVPEFFAMHVTGRYMVGADLDFRNVNQSYGSWFSGNVDFQGHKVYLDVDGSSSYLFYRVQTDAVFSNMDVHFYLNNPSARANYYGLYYDYRGTTNNLKITVEEATNVPNVNFCLIAYVNRGTVNNFVINNKAGLHGERWTTLGMMHNYGSFKNGYVYGQDLDVTYPTSYHIENKRVGALAGYAGENSKIENVFSLISINVPAENSTLYYTMDNRVGSLVGEYNRGSLTNVYALASGENRALNYDALTAINGTVIATNAYYFGDRIFTSTYSTKIGKLALRDVDFQNILNADKAFSVDNFVNYGYFPQIIWPDCMPNQEYLELPVVDDADLVDITNVKSTESFGDYSTAVLRVNNPNVEKIVAVDIAKIKNVEIIDQVTANGKTELTIKLSNPDNYISKYYVSSISTLTATGKTYTRKYDTNERVLLIDMYRKINNTTDWLQMNTYPSENFMLMNDLDFNNVVDTYFKITNVFRGKFNGNDHTIKNLSIHSGMGIFQELTGSILNVNIENVVRESGSSTDMFGTIGRAYAGSKIDNVHVNNIILYGQNRIGGLVGYADGTSIYNSSVSNPSIDSNIGSMVDLKIGGLVGEIYNSDVQNCFVENVNFDVTKARLVQYIGGMFGYSGSGTMTNLIATGKIKTNFQEVGGISGRNNTFLSNIISNVDIESTADYLGGVAGYSTGENISNALVLGSLYTSLDAMYEKRIAGNIQISSNVYAWENQKINGLISGQINGETLLTNEQLKSSLTFESLMNLDDNFNYDNIDGILPKLNNTSNTSLLPFQSDNKYYNGVFHMYDFVIDKQISNANVQFKVENPDNKIIKSIVVDDMNIANIKIQAATGYTLITMNVIPEKFFDSYKISKILYEENGSEKSIETSVKINIQFYKDLGSYEDWSKISQVDAENYRLVSDIDFEGLNPKANVKFNRLEILKNNETQNSYTLKNINLTFKDSNNYLINSVISNINNVKFENVIINNVSTYDVVNNGIIGFLFGYASDLSFKDITLNLRYSAYSAPIVYDRTIDLKNVDLNNITVIGRDYSAGLIARSTVRGITNITADTLNITGYGSFVAGIIAHCDWVSTPVVYHIDVDNANIVGKYNYVGGAFGYGAGLYVTVNNSNITGNGERVGGVAGTLAASYVYYQYVNNCIIKGSSYYIGGIAGTNSDLYYAYVTDCEIYGYNDGDAYVGGIVGYGGWTTYRCGVRNTKINSLGRYVGGIKGYISWGTVCDCYVLDTEVTGAEIVGGIVGRHTSYSNTICRNITNATVNATVSAAGGILGYAVNALTNDTTDRIYVYQNIVANSNISAPTQAGGLIGRSDVGIFKGHMYANLISANVNKTSTASTATSGIVVGNNDLYGASINNIRIYDGSTLNGTSINPQGMVANMAYSANSFVNLAALSKSNTYTDIGINGNFNFSKLAEGYYPYNSVVLTGYYGYFRLPTVDTSSGASNLRNYVLRSSNIEYFHELPKYNIYASGIDTFNIEFPSVDLQTKFMINNKEYVVNKKVFTFSYNYLDDFSIVVSDDVNSYEDEYKSDDIRNKVYVFEDKYYFIKDNKLVTNNGNIDNIDNVLNIYDNKLLYNNGDIVSLINNNVIDSANSSFYLNVITNPLYTFNLNNSLIKTYYGYSSVNDEDINNIMLVKNSKLEMIMGGASSLMQSIIVDGYNNNSYLTMLSSDGYIFNLKDKIGLPSDLDNNSIVAMSNNLNSNTNLVAIMYENNSVLVFDYRNGNIVYNEYKNTDSLIDYFVKKLSPSKSSTFENKVMQSYNDSKELISELNDTNIESVLNKTSDVDNSYISVYNNVTSSYEVYDVGSIVNVSNTSDVDVSKLEDSVSDTINTTYVLNSRYTKINDNSNKKIALEKKLIYIFILSSIIVSSIILFKALMARKQDMDV